MSLRKRIVILGGGVGALTTAYYLTSKPGWQQECEITVYQLGWRLGGKGASSRRDSEIGLRIEEHGLHVWFGFYENAFSLMRACYRELGRPWEEAFKHQDDIHLMEDVEGRWSLWRLPFPQAGPGEPGQGNAEHSPWHVLISLVDFVREYVDEWLKECAADKHIGPATIPQTALQMSARAKRRPAGDPVT